MADRVWQFIFEHDGLFVSVFGDTISIIRNIKGDDTEILIDRDDFNEICKAFLESEE